MMKLWIDDVRPAPDGWEHVTNYDDAVLALQTARYDVVSFDNDLGAGSKEGYQIADWLEAAVYRGEVLPPKLCLVHSMNPVARERIAITLRRFTCVD